MKFISLLFSASVAVCGCSMVNGLSGMMETVEADVRGGYSCIDASSNVKVVMTDGASVATVSADTEVLPYVVTELSGKTLKIYVKESYRFRHGIGTVEVILPANDNIRRVSLSGASSFRSESPLAADSFKVNLCGASRFSAESWLQEMFL
ncbi:MAG: DUF2807 domain-containing protein [Bacteroidales bacterium]|nr:DUF2807 domain-containing protein [Bacteroidales bacterium]